jgi:signal transduction histidine kinase
MTAASSWSTQQLGEFLAAVSALGSAAAAARGAVERAAEALDAEVAAIVVPGEVIASVGYPAGRVPTDDLEAVAAGRRRQLDVPGVGSCEAVAIALDHPPLAALVVARSGVEGLSSEEVGVVHGMARVTSMALRILGLLDEERTRQLRLEWLANEQAALRRVATLVAQGLPPEAVFAAVAEEISQRVAAELEQKYPYEADGSAVRVAAFEAGSDELPIGAVYAPGGHNMITLVFESGRPARIDDASMYSGSTAALARQLGVRSVVGAPIVVDGRLWGAVMASTSRREPLTAGVEERIASFTELVATALSNAQARADLAASRLRVVAAADDMRRRIERNLHDGTQQRLVTLALKLRRLHDDLPAGLPDVEAELASIGEGLVGLLEELREISRGLHPPALFDHGLGPALRSLVRRAVMPVELDIRLSGRLPESVEVAAYYVVSEALANAAKHAGASGADVELAIVGDEQLTVMVKDDGCGGADPAGGSGLIGLWDRVEALGGTMVLTSPPGLGTTLRVELPLSGL